MSDVKSILRSDKPILNSPTKYERNFLVPSAVTGKFKCLSQDQKKVLSVLPGGQIVWNDVNGHDGGYEAGELDGNRLFYDYDEMTTNVPPGNPVVFDVMVKK